LFQFGKGWNCTTFLKNGTELRQKFKYRYQIENEEMTSTVILTRGIVTATSPCHCHVAPRQLTCDKLFIFKKNKKNKKSRNWHVTSYILFNVVIIPLTERTWLHQISQNKDQIEIRKNKGTKFIFYYENGD